MKKKKLILSLLCTLGLFLGLCFFSNVNDSNVNKVHAEEPNSSEVVNSSEKEKDKELDELVQEYIDKKFSDNEWYQENKTLINALVTFICGALGSALSIAILTHTSKKTINSMNSATGDIKSLAQNQAKINELSNQVEEMKKENQELKSLVANQNATLKAVKDSVAVAYLNDPKMQDGRSRKISEIMNQVEEI